MQSVLDWNEIKPGDLTGFLAEVEAACGMEAVRFLVERYGGATLSIPKLASGGKPADELEEGDLRGWILEIAEAHSAELALAIVRLRRGEQVYVPVATKLVETVIGRSIRKAYNGRNAAELAQRYGLPQRKVRQLALKREH